MTRFSLKDYNSVFPDTTHLQESLSLSLRPSLCLRVFLLSLQVWYLSGWVCYLQMQRAGEHWAGEAREASEAEQEEYDALKEAARSYLTRAKKVCVSHVDGTVSAVLS